ncbi:MAG: hypothetical protein HYV90_00770 [Candidatus Woesebacteria bacterium]|nr:MAG: hypothetical protein HYV90_00770 [Candidatus Woesebacteria bacterium]
MTTNWFTDFPGSWDPKKARANFTKGDPLYSYAAVIKSIRDWFYLKKTKVVGEENGTGVPRIYKDAGLQVYVDQFKWGDFVQVDGEPQPLLQFKMRVFRDRPQLRRQPRPPELLIDKWVEIRFDPRWPYKPPHVRIDDPRYKRFDGDMHSNHMYENGWVCFFADSDDWVKGRDTIISFMQAFFDWAVWHYDKHGW